MKHPTDEQLLAFLDGSLDESERSLILEYVERSPEGAAALRAAALGLARVQDWSAASGSPAAEGLEESSPPGGASEGPAADPSRGPRRLVPAWAIPLSVAATLAIAVPLTASLFTSPGDTGDTTRPSPLPTPTAVGFAGAPDSPDPSFVLVLHGRWPDAATVDPAETRRRADEYWAWTTELARRGVLVAAGDLRWEPGLRLEGPERWNALADEVISDPGFLVGMFAIRTDSYEEALALAEECPHLAYGGSISVRRVGGGFVTVPGMGDWTD